MRAFVRIELSVQYLVRSWSTIVELIKRLRSFEVALHGKDVPDGRANQLSK